MYFLSTGSDAYINESFSLHTLYHFLNTGSDAHVGGSFPALGLCFVFKKDFSKTLFQFYQQIFHHPLSLEHHGSI